MNNKAMCFVPSMFASLEAALVWYALATDEQRSSDRGQLAKLALSLHGSPTARETLFPTTPAVSQELRAEERPELVVSGHSRMVGAEGPGCVAEHGPIFDWEGCI